jgi:predicted MFS family arabinose efflux permease
VPRAKADTQIVSSLGAIVGCVIGPLVGGRLGRRPAYFMLCLASLVLCAILFRQIDRYGALFLVLVGAVGCATASFYGWLPLYLPELFPTRVRATGQGLSFNSGRILASLGALQMGQLMQHYGGSYARAGATITLVYICGMVLIWFAPETKGRPLPA